MTKNATKSTSKRKRTSKTQPQSQPIQPSGGPSQVNAITSRGDKGKAKVLEGQVYIESEMEGTTFWELVKRQHWERFLSSEYTIFPEWVNYFYSHVSIDISSSEIAIRLPLARGSFVYDSSDFLEDFGLMTSGFAEYARSGWTTNVMRFVEMTEYLNNGRRFRETYEGNLKDDQPCLHFYTGEARFVHNCVMKALTPIGNQDRNPNKITSTLTYLFLEGRPINVPFMIASHMVASIGNKKSTTLPYGMLITHIMRKWEFESRLPPGPPSPPSSIVRITRRSFRNQLLAFYMDRLWWKWEAKGAPAEIRREIEKIMGGRRWFREVDDIADPIFSDDEPEVSTNEEDDEDDDDADGDDSGGDNVEGGGEEPWVSELRSKKQNETLARLATLERENTYLRETVIKNDKVKIENQKRLLRNDEIQMAQQDKILKENSKIKRYFKGFLKYLSCVGDPKGKGKEHLEFSDSDEEEVRDPNVLAPSSSTLPPTTSPGVITMEDYVATDEDFDATLAALTGGYRGGPRIG